MMLRNIIRAAPLYAVAIASRNVDDTETTYPDVPEVNEVHNTDAIAEAVRNGGANGMLCDAEVLQSRDALWRNVIPEFLPRPNEVQGYRVTEEFSLQGVTKPLLKPNRASTITKSYTARDGRIIRPFIPASSFTRTNRIPRTHQFPEDMPLADVLDSDLTFSEGSFFRVWNGQFYHYTHKEIQGTRRSMRHLVVCCFIQRFLGSTQYWEPPRLIEKRNFSTDVIKEFQAKTVGVEQPWAMGLIHRHPLYPEAIPSDTGSQTSNSHSWTPSTETNVSIPEQMRGRGHFGRGAFDPKDAPTDTRRRLSEGKRD